MSGLKLLIAAVVLLLLAGGVFLSNREEAKKKDEPAKDAPPKILALQEGDITRLSMRRQDGTETVLQKDAAGKWLLAAPKQLAVDIDAVTGITNNFTSLVSDRVVEDQAGDLAQYGLKQPSLTIDIAKKDGKSEKLLIGDETPTGGGVFVMRAGDSKVYTMPTSIKSGLDKTWQDLRDKRLLTFDQDKLTRVELNAKKSPVEFGKNNQNEWTILKPKPLRADGWQVEELIRKLKEAKMDTGVSDDDAKKAASGFAGGTPVAVAKVTDASGTQTIEVRKVKDDYFAKSSVIEGVHKVAADLGTGLDKSVDDFRNKKLFDFGFNEPSKIEFKDGAKAPVVYAKTGDKWFAGPKQIDSTSLQNFVDKLRDLSATKFLDSGFTTASFEITVTSNEGKRTEKVLVGKSGNDWLARRDNEPSVYQLEAAAAEGLTKAAGDVKEAQAAAPAKK